jgi:predicted Zn-dependent protease
LSGLLLSAALLLNPTPVGVKAYSHTCAFHQVAEQVPASVPLDPAVARHEKDLESDRKLGKQYSEEVEKELKLSENKEMLARVERIGQVFAKIANETPVEVTWGDSRLSKFDYTFKLVQGKDVNAFSIPGGYIYVYEGLVNFVESDDELAGVMAHEVAHASLRHIATLQRESSKLSIITIPLILVGILTGNAGILTGGQLLGQALGSGWSVKAEEASDWAGFQYMLKSEYNPIGMMTMMERLAYQDRMSARIDWGIFQTHPPSLERAQSLRDRLLAANLKVERSKVTTSMATQISPQEDGTVKITYLNSLLYTFRGENAKDRAIIAAERLDGFFDQIPKIHDVRQYGFDSIEGKGVPLIQIESEEVEAHKEGVTDLLRKTEAAIKRATYELSYRVWDFYAR